jgi:hypothetical protein
VASWFPWRFAFGRNTSMSSGKTVKRLNLLEKLISASRVMAMKLDPMEGTMIERKKD